MQFDQLESKCSFLRKKILETCIKAKTGHVTSSFSCVEILVALYYTDLLRLNPVNLNDDNRDRFILSKAQASPLLYAILADRGFFSLDELERFAQKDGIFGVHLQNSVPGVETTGGALGHGLGLACGIALRAKMDRKLYLTYVLLGDGELYEGSVWEGLKFAAHYRLNNLVGIIDRNYLCTTDFTEDLIELEPLVKKFESFGWNAIEIDGHNLTEIIHHLRRLRSRSSSRPTVLICQTVKGKGLPCMSYQPLLHGVPPEAEMIETAKREVGL